MMSRQTRLAYWMTGAFAAAMLAITCVAVAGPSADRVADVRPATQPSALAAFPVPVIELSGDGVGMGTGHGQQLGAAVRELHEKYLNVYLVDQKTRFMALLAAAGFNARMRPEHRAE